MSSFSLRLSTIFLVSSMEEERLVMVFVRFWFDWGSVSAWSFSLSTVTCRIPMWGAMAATTLKEMVSAA